MSLSLAKPVVVSDVMSAPVYTLDQEDTLKEAATLLASSRVSGAPVVDAAGRLVGILTEGDVLRALEREADRAKVVKEEGYSYILKIMSYRDVAPQVLKSLAAVRVRDAMTKGARTTTRDTSLDDVAREMSEQGINRLPVLEDEKLVGIISRADIVRGLAKYHLPSERNQ